MFWKSLKRKLRLCRKWCQKKRWYSFSLFFDLIWFSNKYFGHFFLLLNSTIITFTEHFSKLWELWCNIKVGKLFGYEMKTNTPWPCFQHSSLRRLPSSIENVSLSRGEMHSSFLFSVKHAYKHNNVKLGLQIQSKKTLSMRNSNKLLRLFQMPFSVPSINNFFLVQMKN